VDHSKGAVWLRLHCLPPRTHAHRLAPPNVLRRYLGGLREELRAHADDPRRATVGARIHRVNVTFRRTTSGLTHVANADPASMADRATVSSPSVVRLSLIAGPGCQAAPERPLLVLWISVDTGITGPRCGEQDTELGLRSGWRAPTSRRDRPRAPLWHQETIRLKPDYSAARRGLGRRTDRGSRWPRGPATSRRRKRSRSCSVVGVQPAVTEGSGVLG